MIIIDLFMTLTLLDVFFMLNFLLFQWRSIVWLEKENTTDKKIKNIFRRLNKPTMREPLSYSTNHDHFNISTKTKFYFTFFSVRFTLNLILLGFICLDFLLALPGISSWFTLTNLYVQETQFEYVEILALSFLKNVM